MPNRICLIECWYFILYISHFYSYSTHVYWLRLYDGCRHENGDWFPSMSLVIMYTSEMIYPPTIIRRMTLLRQPRMWLLWSNFQLFHRRAEASQQTLIHWSSFVLFCWVVLPMHAVKKAKWKTSQSKNQTSGKQEHTTKWNESIPQKE